MSPREELQSWLDEVTFRSVWPIVERALAAERAATLDEARLAIEAKAEEYRQLGLTEGPPNSHNAAVMSAAACLVNSLSHDRSALDALLRQAHVDGFDAAGEPMACDHAQANLQPCDEGPEVCVVCRLLRQARAQQREKDALTVDAVKRAIEEGRVGTNLQAPIQTIGILSEIAVAIRGQK